MAPIAFSAISAACWILLVLRGTLLTSYTASRHRGLLESLSAGTARTSVLSPMTRTAHQVSNEEFWAFLKHLHLISYDLTTSGSQTEAWIKTLLAHTAVTHDKIAVANASWDSLLQVAGAGMGKAAAFTRDALPAGLLSSHTPVGRSDHDALQALRDHSIPILHSIRTVIGTDVRLERSEMETHS